MGLLEKLQASEDAPSPHPQSQLTKISLELELYRLEQKYTQRKNRNTFTTGAQYRDGEYVYNDASSPVSQTSTGSSSRKGNRASIFLGGKHR